jgi:hypothetical protein
LIPLEVDMLTIEPRALLNALCLIDRLLFPADLESELRKVGASDQEVLEITLAYRSSGCKLLLLYSDYVYPRQEAESQWGGYLSGVLENLINEYTTS